MHPTVRTLAIALVLMVACVTQPFGQTTNHLPARYSGGAHTYTIENNSVKLDVTFEGDRLLFDNLEAQPLWAEQYGASQPPSVGTDADFALDLMYTDWQAPGKANNAENPVTLTKRDFRLVDDSSAEAADGGKELVFYMKARESTIELVLKYTLRTNEFYVRRNVAVMDTVFGHHFLRWVWPRSGFVSGVRSVVKSGGFGQPVAVLLNSGGAFFGLEYPTSENRFEIPSQSEAVLKCGQEMGAVIAGDWLASEWVVEGITPNSFVKDWFFRYIDAIRVVLLRPFTLYNSWYDLRSPEYPRVPQEHWMGEQSALMMARLLRENMIRKHEIRLDAFVLDDGWDVYESDWALRKDQWPNGLTPLAEELKETNTTLGMWLGPTGGYSFRMRRVNWMKEHGYEVVGKTRDNAMLCVAGKNYSAMLERRVTDFVTNNGVGYFKWDGIQFSCSEPNHGHPVDIYSRRAVMESIIAKCRAVREKNPDVFLNITSGTWLSPWWVKYANTIWMQGADYGYSDVPSLNQRDGAITYRDFILYDDFRNLDLWFPVANLMTHGIIKGKLELLGSPEEPLDTFTDDVVLYVARGISMYELYISPDILSDGEWNSMSTSLRWARDHFPVLTASSTMIGGNPMNRETYGYTHFTGEKGIVAARNPFITPGTLDVELAVSQGLDPTAESLVVEKVYPNRRIEPRLYRAGEKFMIPLEGYETAVYEVYPIEEAAGPLVGGVSFDVGGNSGKNCDIQIHGSGRGKLLNPDAVESAFVSGKSVNPASASFSAVVSPEVVSEVRMTPQRDRLSTLKVQFTLSPSARDAMLAILLTPDSSVTVKEKPTLNVALNGKNIQVKTESQEGKSQWYTVQVDSGKHEAIVELRLGKDEKAWQGTAQVWLITKQREQSEVVSFTMKHEMRPRQLLPPVWQPGEARRSMKLGAARLTTSR